MELNKLEQSIKAEQVRDENFVSLIQKNPYLNTPSDLIISFDNTVTSCKKCNERKDDKTLYEANMFYKDRRYKPYQPTIAEFTQKLVKSMGINDLIRELFD